MPTDRPDILLIVLDTLRRDRLSVYGHARPTSPALDAFAADSVRFTQAISPAQWTIPAHAALFTGLYPGAHGVTQAYHRLSGLHPTLAETLQATGYHTAAFSNNPLVGVLDNDLRRGFADFFSYAGAAVTRPADTAGPLRRLLRDRWRRFAMPTQNRFAHSDTLFRISMNPLFVPLWTRFVHYTGDTARSVSDLIAYLGQPRSAPLFAFLNLMGAHLPYRPPRAALEIVAPDAARDRQARAFVRRFNAEAARWATPTDPPLADWQRAALLDHYDASIRAQDAHLGRLLAHLRQTGALDHTLVIIVADHGEEHGDHGCMGHSFVVHQELVHVPLLVRWPDRRGSSTVIDRPVSTRRIFHTALDAAGAVPPLDAADPNANVPGLSLACTLADAPDADGDAVYAEAYTPTTLLSLLERRAPHLIDRLRLRETRRAIYADGWKLVTVGEDIGELYDPQADPSETHNLAAAEPQQAAALQARLNAFVADQAARAEGIFPLSPQADAAIIANLRALGYIE